MSSDRTTARAGGKAAGQELRPLEEIRPPQIFEELRTGVLGQDPALHFVSVAIYKHTTGRVSGNILLIGNSGTGKTTIMNNVQRLYDTIPEYQPFRVMTILNANLLVDSERTEFQPERIFTAVEQRARLVVGEKPSPEDLKEAIERATICIDEIDKMTSVVLGKPNPIGIVLQQGLLTLMEGERVPYRTRAWVDGEETQVTLELETDRMMFVCGGAFEGLYDLVYHRVTKKGSGQRIKASAVRTAEGQIRIEERFSLADYLRMPDLFGYGMVPQFMSRFDKLVLLQDLSIDTLKEILLQAWDSPFLRSRRYFETMKIELVIEELAAALIAEEAVKESRTGARALRDIFSEVVNPFEYDPWSGDVLQEKEGGGRRLTLSAEVVRGVLKKRGR